MLSVWQGHPIPFTNTHLWTAGTTPNPLLKTLPVEHDQRGAVAVVDRTLTVPSHAGVWAVGGGLGRLTDRPPRPNTPTLHRFAHWHCQL